VLYVMHCVALCCSVLKGDAREEADDYTVDYMDADSCVT